MGTAISKGKEGRNTFYKLPNELVFEMCRTIAAIPTSEQILLSAQIIWAYLAPQFRKKLIYRDVVAFLKAGLKDRTKKVTIRISQVQVADGNENEQHVLIEQRQSEDEFVLSTNQMSIRIETGKLSTRRYKIKCEIADWELKNAHLFYFVRLLAPLVPRPSALLLPFLVNDSITLRHLNTFHGRVDWIELFAEQFILPPICMALEKCDKLRISFQSSYPSNDHAQQFRRALIQWLNRSNNGGRPSLCKFDLFRFAIHDELGLLLDDIKRDFCNATSKTTFGLCIRAYLQAGIEPFRVLNNIGEQLQFRHKHYGSYSNVYTLIRLPIAELGSDREKELMLEIEEEPRFYFS